MPTWTRQRRTLAASDTRFGVGEPTFAALPPVAEWAERELFVGDTCQIDVIDRHGNMVAATPSGGWLSSSPVVPALGFPLTTRLQMTWLDDVPGQLQPGKRPLTTLSPGLALRDGKPYMVYGTPGGDQQDQWTVQFFLRHAAGLNLQEAIEAPSWHVDHFPGSFWPRAFKRNRVTVESRMPAATIEALRQAGHEVVIGPAWSEGRISACTREAAPEGGLLPRAGANPRGMRATRWVARSRPSDIDSSRHRDRHTQQGKQDEASTPETAGRRPGLALTAPGLSRAAWPDDKPITLIVPWSRRQFHRHPGARAVRGLTQSLKQSVIVENRSGASGNIGSTYVARAKPDGYTLLVGSMSTHTMNQALYANMPFDGVKDFTPIAELALVTNTMVTHPSVPANNVREFIDYLKANPDKVAYASAGQGSTNHLSAALFEKAAGVKMVHVPYRGGAPAVLDTVAGRTGPVQRRHANAAARAERQAQAAGRHRGTALAAAAGHADRGRTLPGYELSVWYGAFGPAGLPADLTTRLNKEINLILKRPDVVKKMADMGVLLLDTTPEQFAKTLTRDADKYGKLIKELGVTAE